MDKIIAIILGIVVWLSITTTFLSGAVLFWGWLFEREAPIYTQDIFVYSIGMFIVALVLIVTNLIAFAENNFDL